MTENQPEQVEPDVSEREVVEQQAADPNQQTEQQPPVPLEGDEKPAEVEQSENARTDAAGRELFPWEVSPEEQVRRDSAADEDQVEGEQDQPQA